MSVRSNDDARLEQPGTGPPGTVHELVGLVRTYKPQIVFLCETRQNKMYVEDLRWRLGLKHVVSLKEEGKGGGVALFWDESINIELFKINSNVIDVIVHDL